MYKYLVFLDIDGVFTSDRVQKTYGGLYPLWCKFDPVAVEFMNTIHDNYPVHFVLMSTWKNHLPEADSNIKHWVVSAFSNSGFRGTLANPWKTNPENKPYTSFARADEVKDYLVEYGKEVEDYILFDDNAYTFDSVLRKKRLVRTDPENGLLSKHMTKAKSIVGQWDKK